MYWGRAVLLLHAAHVVGTAVSVNEDGVVQFRGASDGVAHAESAETSHRADSQSASVQEESVETPYSFLQTESRSTSIQGCAGNSHYPVGRTWPIDQVEAILEYKHRLHPSLDYCDREQLPIAEGKFEAFLAAEGGWPTMDSSLAHQLRGPKPVIVFSIDHKVSRDSLVGKQLGHLFCRLEQLDLLSRTVVLDLGEQDTWSSFCPNKTADGPCAVNVFRDDKFLDLARTYARQLSFHSVGRLGKHLFALYLMELGHQVLVSDPDTVWLRDPLPYFESVNVDLMAMQDSRCVELNSGFVFYRPTERSTAMLKTALGKPLAPEAGMPFDSDQQYIIKNLAQLSDQYLFNCAWAYHTVQHGLKYAVLDDRFAFGGFGWNDRPYGLTGRIDQAAAPLDTENLQLLPTSVSHSSLDLPLYVWHTSDYSSYVAASENKLHKPGAREAVRSVARRQLAMLTTYFPWSETAAGKCPAPMSDPELRAAERRLYTSCVDEYNPTCSGSTGPYGRRPVCSTTVTDLIRVARAMTSLGVASWAAEPTRSLVEMDACISNSWTGLQEQNGHCAVNAGDALRDLQQRPGDELANYALARICWDGGPAGGGGGGLGDPHQLRIEPMTKRDATLVHAPLPQDLYAGHTKRDAALVHAQLLPQYPQHHLSPPQQIVKPQLQSQHLMSFFMR